MRKILIMLLITVVCVAMVLGCDTNDTNNGNTNQNSPNQNALDPNNVDGGNANNDKNNDKSNDDKVDKQKVMIYYVNEEYVVTGNEELEHVIPIETELILSDNKTIAELAVEELQKEPEADNLSTQINLFTINSVKTEADTVIVDFAREGLHGGSLQERMVLSQLVSTLTGIEGINKVQILVDGQVAETLMGHIMIDEPFSKE